MTFNILKILIETFYLITMGDSDFSDKEDKVINEWMKKFWMPQYGSVDVFLEEVCGEIQNFSKKGVSWKEKMKENSIFLSKKLHKEEKTIVFNIMENIIFSDNVINPKEQELLKILEDNFKLQ